MSLAMPVATAPIPNALPFFVAGEASGFAAEPAHAPGATASPDGRRVRSNGRLKEGTVSNPDRHIAIATHLSLLAFIWVGPLALAAPVILWLSRKDRSVFADDHGREATNFVLSFVLLHIILAVTLIGLVLLPVLWVTSVVGLVRGAIAASQNEYFRYPMTIRFL